MTLITFPAAPPAPKRHHDDRRSPAEILPELAGGASPRGSSYWKRLRTCPREHGLYKLGLRRSGDHEALTVGLLHHAALEAYYRAVWAWQHALGTKPKRNDEFYWGNQEAAEGAAWAVVEQFQNEPGYQETYETVQRLLASYFDRYRRQDRWRVLAVEETLEYHDSSFAYSARLDLIVEREDGGMWIVEHKTARTITPDLVDNYQMDIQILGQCWLLRAVVDLEQYPQFRGVLINITTKHKAPQNERVEVCPSRYHLDAFEESQEQWFQIGQYYERLGWPKALGNCAGAARFFQKCDYYDVCHGHPRATVEDVSVPHGYYMVEEGNHGS